MYQVNEIYKQTKCVPVKKDVLTRCGLSRLCCINLEIISKACMAASLPGLGFSATDVTVLAVAAVAAAVVAAAVAAA